MEHQANQETERRRAAERRRADALLEAEWAAEERRAAEAEWAAERRRADALFAQVLSPLAKTDLEELARWERMIPRS